MAHPNDHRDIKNRSKKRIRVPYALNVLAAELEDTQRELEETKAHGVRCAQNAMRLAGEVLALKAAKAEEVLALCDIEVLVELADELAVVFGQTKDNRFRDRVREIILKHRQKGTQ